MYSTELAVVAVSVPIFFLMKNAARRLADDSPRAHVVVVFKAMGRVMTRRFMHTPLSRRRSTTPLPCRYVYSA